MKQTLKYIYSVVYENLKFAEAKHTIVLTLAGAVLAFATTFFSESLVQNMFAIASIIFSLIAIFYSIVALAARNVRVKSKNNHHKANLIYYKDIMHFGEKEYIDAIKKEYEFTNIYKPDNMDYDLAKQIIIVSKLAFIKYLYFNFAIVFLFFSVICLIITVLIRGQIW